ncbi:MAG: hypothetical protein QM766_18840 [Burkholderiaceae bacterium]
MWSSFSGQLVRVFGTLTVVLLAGCSGLSPQIFSERLMAERNTEGADASVQPPNSLEEAYADASHVQRLYLTAVRDQSNLTPRLAAGLIGLSAVTMYRGLTSPGTHSLAALGAVGAATYGYGRLVASPTRLDVYRAGAEALSCAMAAVEPLRIGQTRLGKADDGPTQRTLYGGVEQVRQRSDELRKLLYRHAGLLESVDERIPGRAASSRTVKRPAPACDSPKDTPPEVALARRAQCERQPTVETIVTIPATPPLSVLRVAPDELRAAADAAWSELERARGSVERAEGAFKAVAAAGALLWHQSVRIQIAVSKQVDATVPDLAAVLRTAQSLPDTAFALTGFSGFAKQPPAESSAQGAPAQRGTKLREATAGDAPAERDLLAATAALTQASRALDAMTLPLTGVAESATREQINACAVRSSGVELKVTPSGDEIVVARGGAAVFFVSGGSGVPSAAVAVGPQAEMPMRVEGGQFRFEYRPPDSARPGDVVVLRFSSGGGHQFVMLRIVEALRAEAGGNATTPNSDPSADPEADTRQPKANTGRPAKP